MTRTPGDTLHVQIWTSYVEAIESYHLTDSQTANYQSLHFRSREKDGDHTIWSAVYSKPHATGKLDSCNFYRTGVMDDQILHCWNRHFRRNRLLWPLPWPDNFLIQTYCLEIYRMCKSELPTLRLWKVIVWQTDRHYIGKWNCKPRRIAGGQMLSEGTMYRCVVISWSSTKSADLNFQYFRINA